MPSDNSKHDIRDRKDIGLLVRTFYGTVRKDALLGPIFEHVIGTEQLWEEHFILLTDFWETQLFLSMSYQGNAMKAHQEVDDKTGHGITMEHFGRWLQHWHSTIDDLFSGDKAWQAKNKARTMSTFMFMKIYEHRKKES